LRDRGDNHRDVLAWRMESAGLAADVGDPTTTTSFHLCVYDGSSGLQPRRMFALPAGGQCDGTACWRPRGIGFAYHSRDQDPDGISAASLQVTSRGGVGLKVRGGGTSLQPPTLPLG